LLFYCFVLVDPLLKYLPEPKLIHYVNFESSVWGLAILNDELFVISIMMPDVIVFDLNTMIRFVRLLEFISSIKQMLLDWLHPLKIQPMYLRCTQLWLVYER